MNFTAPKNLVVALLLAPACHAHCEPAPWQLPPGAVVDGSGVFLSQVLKNPPTAVPTLRLAPAPPWGQTNFLTRDQIIELARGEFPALETTNWTGPPQVRLTRRSRQLLDFQLLELLSAALQQRYVRDHAELEAALARPWTPLAVPEEALTLKLTEFPVDGLLPVSMVGFELWAGKERVGAFRLAVQAKLWREAPVARSPLYRGQLLRDADIALERRDVLARRESFVNLAAADPSAELSENIPPGQPILQHCVRSRPIIRRGQIVDAVFQQGSLRISLKVETLEEGALGQTVRVRNPRTHRDLYGKVQNEETIAITL